MLVYARPRTAEKKPINLYEFATQHFGENPQITLDIPKNLVWNLDEEYLLQIVSNLVGNAFDAGATQVWVEARREGQNLVWERFFTTKSTGTGLGLAIVRSAAEIQGGSISVKQASGKTIFEIIFPNGSGTTGNY